jgi:type II pantothenate kinase
MSHFSLLSDPRSYATHDLNLVGNQQLRARWLDVFEKQFEEILSQAAFTYGRMSARSVSSAREQFSKTIASLRQDDAAKLTLNDLFLAREKCLHDNGLKDPFGQLKTKENLSWTEVYPKVVRHHRMLHGDERWQSLIGGIFAAGLFDPFSKEMSELSDKREFFVELKDAPPRPWLIDNFDTFKQDLQGAPPAKWTKAIFFVDNAGSDFVVGVMPLAREFALAGVKVVFAANETPAMGTITADEAATLIEQLAIVDDDLAALIQGEMFEVVSTGAQGPLLDLANVSDELNNSASDTDLLIFEGMGKAVVNISAEFSVDTLKVAILKDDHFASLAGGQFCDCVFQYHRASK